MRRAVSNRASRRRFRQQSLTGRVQVDQGEGGKESIAVFLQASVTHLHESELQLQHRKHVLDLGARMRDFVRFFARSTWLTRPW